MNPLQAAVAPYEQTILELSARLAHASMEIAALQAKVEELAPKKQETEQVVST